MSHEQLSIGSLAAKTKCPVPTIRYYEEIGLLPKAKRTESGHRYYGQDDADRLGFIKRCRDFGFPIEQVRSLVALMEDGDRACVEVRDLAAQHLTFVRSKLLELNALERTLKRFVSQCTEECIDGPTRDCAIVLDLTEKAKSSTYHKKTCCEPEQRAAISVQRMTKRRAGKALRK